MYINKKCKNTKYLANIYGEELELRVHKVGQCLNIRVLPKNTAYVYRKSVFLCIVVLFNLFCALLNILNLNICIVIFLITLVYLFKLCAIVKEENLIKVKNLGIQIQTKYVLGFKNLFIPNEKITQIFINEVFFHQRVIYLLTIMTKEAAEGLKLIPLFLETAPNIKCLQIIYKHLKE